MQIIALPLSRVRLPAPSRFTTRLPHFVALMKPRVMLLAVFTAPVGLMIAPGHLDPLLGFVAILAIAAGAGPSTIWRWYTHENRLPKPIELSPGVRGWTEEQLEEIFAQRRETADA
jgi:predicted DNA-binding transcriptional regulator AlpA